MVWGDYGGVLCEAWSGCEYGGVLCEAWSGVTMEVCCVKYGLGVGGGVLCEAWSGVWRCAV